MWAPRPPSGGSAPGGSGRGRGAAPPAAARPCSVGRGGPRPREGGAPARGGVLPVLDRQVGLALVEGRRARERRGEFINGHPLLPYVIGGVHTPGFVEVS